MVSESKQIANQYIFSFARDAESLLSTWAIFNNLLIFLQSKYFNWTAIKQQTSEKDIAKVIQVQQQVLRNQNNPQEQQALIDLTSNLRTWITHTHTRYVALQKRKILPVNERISVLFNNICNPDVANFIPNNLEIKEYCEIMHDLLNERVIAEALADMQATYSSINNTPNFLNTESLPTG